MKTSTTERSWTPTLVAQVDLSCADELGDSEKFTHPTPNGIKSCRTKMFELVACKAGQVANSRAMLHVLNATDLEGFGGVSTVVRGWATSNAMEKTECEAQFQFKENNPRKQTSGYPPAAAAAVAPTVYQSSRA